MWKEGRIDLRESKTSGFSSGTKTVTPWMLPPARHATPGDAL
jgi:hypothetical protein